MKTIYILLSKTNTVPSKLIHAIKGGRFTHVSVALEARTDRFFSFARRKLNNALVGGFIIEGLHKGIFSKYPDNQCEMYSLDVTEDAYESILRQIQSYMENYEKATYNFAGLFTMIIGKASKPKLKHTCSQFVATLLESSNAVKLPKSSHTMLPTDFLNLESIKPIYKGTIGNCDFPSDVKLK